tara:strand:+ start:1814 stop:2893 length:1080 start_codon:yes stop_codon:yes gene_type:complete
MRTYEWLLLAVSCCKESYSSDYFPQEYRNQIPLQITLPSTAYLELPNILGAYLRGGDALEEIIKEQFIQLTQTSSNALRPLQRGEIIAYQFISGRFKNCFDLLKGVNSEEFFDAWEQFEFLSYLLGYSNGELYKNASFGDLLHELNHETCMLLNLVWEAPKQEDLNYMTDNSWTNLIAERIWTARQIHRINFQDLDFNPLIQKMDEEKETLEDITALILLQLASGASIENSFNKLREILNSRWEKGQDRWLVKLLRALVLAGRNDLSHEIFPKIVRTEFKITALLLMYRDHQFLGCSQRFPDPKKTTHYLQTQKQLNSAIAKAQRLRSKVEFLEKGLKFGFKVIVILILILLLDFFGVL